VYSSSNGNDTDNNRGDEEEEEEEDDSKSASDTSSVSLRSSSAVSAGTSSADVEEEYLPVPRAVPAVDTATLQVNYPHEDVQGFVKKMIASTEPKERSSRVSKLLKKHEVRAVLPLQYNYNR
jgi:hypothetical protein